MLDKRSNDGFTKELVVVVVEAIVEELELGVKAINGGSDTMKSKAMQNRTRRRKQRKVRE